MILYLLRHAHAVDAGTGGIERDEDRPLSPAGMEQARRASRAIRAWGVKPDAILASPYLRARQTAGCLAGEVPLEIPIEEVPELIPGSDPWPLLEAVLRRGEGSRLLLVGHLPLLGRLVSTLVWGEGSAEVPFRPAGMACLTVIGLRPRPAARLEWLATPEQYPEIG